MSDYFQPSPDRAMIDRAALIVAIIAGRESATRTDYAHPKIAQIVEILKEAAVDGGATGKNKK